ncbi:hypothetical protein Lfu02_35890 [Longispora fulva]|uniref:Protein phosphatase 2C-like protein n=1 Tax=Longispora fulva TaxID=619741 RepID=A0A8J7GYH4_9ACTN|nr:hypothetical protein [Longispora fulva]MBG6141629.1 hypothetical protein [Longispora fulva]GIG59217.1 hypothetical protein Lfu02_35890 [Longispora fulva]
MRVRIASESGRPDGRNEDWGGASGGVAVVLDGLTEGPATGCRHGTPWYVRQLGDRLLRLGADREAPLTEVLAGAISEVAGLHASTCDLAHPGSPCSTVTIVRDRSDATVDYLVLSDSSVVLDVADGEPVVVTDRSVENFHPDMQAGAARRAVGLTDLIDAQQKIRNRPDGYWVAQVDPRAADHATTGTLPGVRGAALLSDGVSLLVTTFHAVTWPSLLAIGYAQGPAELIRRTRELEDTDPRCERWPRYKHRDDATAAIVKLAPPDPDR